MRTRDRATTENNGKRNEHKIETSKHDLTCKQEECEQMDNGGWMETRKVGEDGWLDATQTTHQEKQRSRATLRNNINYIDSVPQTEKKRRHPVSPCHLKRRHGLAPF